MLKYLKHKYRPKKSNICLLVKETYAIMEWNVKKTKNMNTDINK